MTEIISFANQKGGVGKTTTAINLGASLANINKTVLLIDLDQQGNAGTGLGFVRSSYSQSIYNVIIKNENIKDNILTTGVKNLHIVPSSLALAGAETDLLEIDNREYILKNKLKDVQNYYDYILIDCPPALGYLTLNALTASDSVIIPLQCEFYALEGIQHLINTINEVHKKWNQNLDILGVLLTMYDKRYTLTKAVEDDVRNTFKDVVFKTVIPRNIRITESPSHGKPVLFYDFASVGAQSYLKVATELVERINKKNGGIYE